MLKIRRSRDRLIFNMGIPLSEDDGLDIETEIRDLTKQGAMVLAVYLPGVIASSGTRLNINTVVPGIASAIMKMLRSRDLLIFYMGISILVRRHFNIEAEAQWPILLTWFNFNLSMDKWSYAQ